jgi:large subunit ribosomal protein L19e
VAVMTHTHTHTHTHTAASATHRHNTLFLLLHRHLKPVHTALPACSPVQHPARPQVKGNVYKNKRVLIESVHKQKAEKVREKAIADQFEARRAKNKAARERKAARREERLTSGVHAEAAPVAAPAPAKAPAKAKK